MQSSGDPELLVSLELRSFPRENMISVIKVVREHTGLGLKETKYLLDSAPAVVLEDVPREQAERLREALEAVGAVAVVGTWSATPNENDPRAEKARESLQQLADEMCRLWVDYHRRNTEEEDERREAEKDARVKAEIEQLEREGKLPPRRTPKKVE